MPRRSTKAYIAAVDHRRQRGDIRVVRVILELRSIVDGGPRSSQKGTFIQEGELEQLLPGIEAEFVLAE